jgi:hypothetical protein
VNEAIVVTRTPVSDALVDLALDGGVQNRHHVRITDGARRREPDVVDDDDVGNADRDWRANQGAVVALHRRHLAVRTFRAD